MSHFYKANKLIVTSILCGTLAFTVSTNSFADLPIQPVYDVKVDSNITSTKNSLLSVLNAIKEKAEAIVTINQKIGDNFSEIYNYLLGQNPEKDSNIASQYYIKAKGISTNSNYNKNIFNIGQSLMNLTLYGEFTSSLSDDQKDSPNTTNNASASYNKMYNYGSYSTTSVDSLLSANKYDISPDDAQTLLSENQSSSSKIKAEQIKAALGFIQNASYASQGLTEIPEGQSSTNSDAKKYAAYLKTISSVQSVANDTLIRSLIARLPYTYDQKDGDGTSQLKNFTEMNVASASNSDYWNPDTDNMGSKGILPRVLEFFTRFFSINYNLDHISKQLERVNVQLAMLITQNTMEIQNNVGSQLYKAYQSSSQTVTFKKDENSSSK
jgi:hypothetical protein